MSTTPDARTSATNIAGLTPVEAVDLQTRMSALVSLEDDFGEITRVAGVDVSTGRTWQQGTCGIVVLSYPGLKPLETAEYTGDVTFPYIPGLLAFREIPLLLEAYKQLEIEPDILILDGQGYAHPRRFGLACHAGIALNKPTIGCAKTRLIGEYTDPGAEPGDLSPLHDKNGERLGDVVRTKGGAKPVFVSPGHRISFDTATRLVLECTRRYRLPEPTRLAHKLVSGGK